MRKLFTLLFLMTCLKAGAFNYYDLFNGFNRYDDLTGATVITAAFDQDTMLTDMGAVVKAFGTDFKINGTDVMLLRSGAIVGYNLSADRMFGFTAFGVKGFTRRDASSSISYTISGITPGQRILTIQFKNAGLEGGAPTDYVNFQIVLYEDGTQMQLRMGGSKIADKSKVFLKSTDMGPQMGIYLLSQDMTTHYEVQMLTGNATGPGISTNLAASLGSIPDSGHIYNFKYVKPNLTLISPIGLENWKTGEHHSIQWRAHKVSKITIEFTWEGFSKYSIVQRGIDANLGTYDWVVPNHVSQTCSIRISDDDSIADSQECGTYFRVLQGAGIKEGAFAPDVKIYPNPSTGIFTLTMPAGISGTSILKDISGKVILTEQVTGGDNFYNSEGLKPGLYLLTISTPEGTATQKIEIR